MNLKRIFIIWMTIMVGILAIYSFFVPSIPKNDKVVDFKVTQNQTLYFKNIRAYFYEKEEIEESGMDVYRLKKIVKDSQVAYYPVIIHNWRHDEAYLMFENRKTKKPAKELYTAIDEIQLTLNKVSIENHQKFALKLMPYLFEDEIVMFNKAKVLEKDKALILLILKDYFKWLN